MNGPGWVVGNDIVDLTERRTRGKSADGRFVARVLSASEAAVVGRAADPDRILWTLWACKEAAFKVATKLLGAAPVFEHRAFVASIEDDDATRASVAWRNLRLSVRVRHYADMLHAVAHAQASEGTFARAEADDRGARGVVHRQGHSPESLAIGVERLDAPDRPWSGTMDELRQRLSSLEADAVHSRASAGVRLAARGALSREMGVEEDRLEIVCAPGATGRRPPKVLLDGGPAPADVSLSHHGRWIAWVIHSEGAQSPPGR